MISIQHQDFSVAQEYEQLNASHYDGAVVLFVGKVRDFQPVADTLDMNVVNKSSTEKLIGLTIEHYPEMTEKALINIANEAKERWTLNFVRIIHRIGDLDLGEQIVLVGVSSAHRQSAFDACQFIMDYLKQKAPFWKKERTKSKSYWVDTKESDKEAIGRWK